MKKLFVILSLLVGVNANAGILLEPYVGYHMGEGSQTGATDTDITGMGFGGRVGWTLPLVFFAFDYSSGGLDAESGSSEVDADYKAMGAVVGASLPMIRIWAGYNFSAELELDSATKYEGNGMKGGLGFKLPALPISINAEYIINEYDEANGTSLTNKYEHTSLFVSISAPLTF